MSSKRPRAEADFHASQHGAAGLRELLTSHGLDAHADALLDAGWDDRDYLVSKCATAAGKAELSAAFLAPPLSMSPGDASRLAEALERAGGGAAAFSTALVESAQAKKAAREEARADKERRAAAERQERLERMASAAEAERAAALPLTPAGVLDVEVDPATMHMYFGHYPGYPDLRRREKVVWPQP